MSRRSAVFWFSAVVAVVSFALVGCGTSMFKMSSEIDADPEQAEAKKEARGGAAAQPAKDGAAPKQAEAPADPAGAKGGTPAKPMIIFTYSLEIIVKDLDAANPEVEKLVAAHNGYIAKSEVRSNTGTRRVATYTLRVPVGADKTVREGLLALGVPERNAVETQDVGEEFVDIEKRIKNLKEREDKLNELLKEKRKEEKLEDVLKVSEQISTVRGQIEQAQGRREFLLNKTSYSTTYLTLREIKDYKPPSEPTFGNRISDTFERSWEGLVGFGKGIVLVCVALAPWAPVWLPALLGGVWGGRKLLRASRESAARGAQARETHVPPPRRDLGGDPEATAIEPVRPPDAPAP